MGSHSERLPRRTLNHVCLLCTCVLANKIKGLVRHGWKELSVSCVFRAYNLWLGPGGLTQTLPRGVKSRVFAVYVCTSQ